VLWKVKENFAFVWGEHVKDVLGLKAVRERGNRGKKPVAKFEKLSHPP